MTDDTEWKCLDCDHVQRGHRFHCEKCGFYIGRVDTAAAEVGEPTLRTLIDRADMSATIERCAQVAEQYAKKHFATSPEGLAAAIRSLKDS